MPEINYRPDPRAKPLRDYPSLDLGGGAPGSVGQQVLLSPDDPVDLTKPALRFPVGGGALEQFDPNDGLWH